MNNWVRRKINRLLGRSDKKFNLLIIGAQKGGTTSLHDALSQHPEICMTSPIKEPGYFLPFKVMQKYYLNKGIKLENKEQYFEKYLLHGYKGEQFFGESSTFYTSKEWSSLALAKSIYNYNPDTKFIFTYRDRKDRIISHFYHELNKNKELTFKDFLQNEESFGISCYYQRLLPFLEVFSRDNILIVQFEEMISNPQNVMRDIFTFLNIDNSVVYKQFPKKNARKNIKHYDDSELKTQIIEHEKYTELLEDDQLFMHIT